MNQVNISQIINLVHRWNGFVFGGYLRDLLAGETPNDLDIWLPNELNRKCFITDLVEICPFRFEKIDPTDKATGMKAAVKTKIRRASTIDNDRVCWRVERQFANGLGRVMEKKKSLLTNGLIPAKQECPFRSLCEIAHNGDCRHQGKNHVCDFSCAVARMFDMIQNS